MSGRIHVVGIGPGSLEHMTAAARQAILRADVVVGYRPYIELLGELTEGTRVESSGMREEVARARTAIREARAGHTVAVVSTGDAGLYGMAGLVLELLGEQPDVDVTVVPGVTAAFAAAAVLGAPLVHDTALISLSDLLTPLPAIERRVRAAAEAGFVIALYNPRSATRTEPLERALAILREVLPAATPVGVVRDALRDGTSARVTTLAELDADGIDMRTTLLIGNAETRVIAGRIVTPRGYSP